MRLGDVATVDVTPTPTVIAHDGVSRSLDVIAEVRGRDAADVAADATERLRQMTFEHEYRAEVLGDAVERGRRRRQRAAGGDRGGACWPSCCCRRPPTAGAGPRCCSSSAPLAGTRGAARRLPASAGPGPPACWRRWSPWWRWRSASRWCSSGGPRCCTRTTRAPAGRRAAVRGAGAGTARWSSPSSPPPPLFLPAAVMGGGAGLEILQPFAVALLAGLVTSTVVVLFLVPALFAASGGLRPAPVVGPDTPDGEPVGAAADAAARRAHGEPTTTTTSRSEKEVQR